VAPCFVYFDATQSDSDGDGVVGEWLSDLVDATFVWNFGDATAAGKSWAAGARSTTSTPMSKNVDMGYVAAHVFEQPGTYTVQLRITNSAGAQASATTVINVSAWNNSTNGPTYCFSTNGTFTGCPSGSTQVTQSDFKAAVNQCTNNGARGARCLFRGGQSFTASGSMSVADGGPSSGTIIAGGNLYGFGSGRATITDNAAPPPRTGEAVFGLRWTNSGGPGADTTKTHMLIWDTEVSCTGCGSAFGGDRGNYNGIIGNYIHDMYSYGWGAALQQSGAFMGNFIEKTGQGDGSSNHAYRNAAATRLVLSHNKVKLDPPVTGRGSTDLFKLNATDYPQGTPTLYLWFYDNDCVANGKNAATCVNYGLQYDGINEPVAKSIFDSNFSHSLLDPPVPITSFEIKNCNSCVLRNNVIQQPDNGAGGITIVSYTSAGDPPASTNNVVVGNSAWNAQGSGCSISAYNIGVPSGQSATATSNTTFRDNLYYFANGTCSVVSCGSSINCTNDHNLRTSTKPFTGLAPTTLDDFKLAAGSNPIGQGASTTGLLVDAVGAVRGTTPDIGAYEFNTAVTQGPPPPPVLMSGQ
jgi:hypothetical protein